MESKGTIVTEEIYVSSRLTVRDKLCGNFFFVPVVLLVILILVGLFVNVSDAFQRAMVGLFVITTVISIALRMVLNARIRRLRREYEEYRKWASKK